MAEKQGRPKTLVRRVIFEIKEDTQEWLSEELNGLKQAFIVGKASRGIGEVLKGILSHPVGVGVFAAVLAAIGLKLGLVDKSKTESVLIEAAAFPPELAGAFTTTHKILRLFFPFLPPLP